MLNHKFYFSDTGKKDNYIRISDVLMQKMKLDLLKYKFIWNGEDDLQYGLSPDITIISTDAIKNLKNCLLKQSKHEKEYDKFMTFINMAMTDNKEIIHENGSPNCMVHDFVICNKFPEKIIYNNYKKDLIKIQDQFILDNYNVFKTVDLYWEDIEHKNRGFNYYGTTLITSQMAKELRERMIEYLKDNNSEQAEYFVGNEYDILCKILDRAISEDKVIIHFGI